MIVIKINEIDKLLIFSCYSTIDKMAYITIGKVLAQRCLESGISDMINTYEAIPNSKVSFVF